jgi:hypothetical protein
MAREKAEFELRKWEGEGGLRRRELAKAIITYPILSLLPIAHCSFIDRG